MAGNLLHKSTVLHTQDKFLHLQQRVTPFAALIVPIIQFIDHNNENLKVIKQTCLIWPRCCLCIFFVEISWVMVSWQLIGNCNISLSLDIHLLVHPRRSYIAPDGGRDDLLQRASCCISCTMPPSPQAWTPPSRCMFGFKRTARPQQGRTWWASRRARSAAGSSPARAWSYGPTHEDWVLQKYESDHHDMIEWRSVVVIFLYTTR